MIGGTSTSSHTTHPWQEKNLAKSRRAAHAAAPYGLQQLLDGIESLFFRRRGYERDDLLNKIIERRRTAIRNLFEAPGEGMDGPGNQVEALASVPLAKSQRRIQENCDCDKERDHTIQKLEATIQNMDATIQDMKAAIQNMDETLTDVVQILTRDN